MRRSAKRYRPKPIRQIRVLHLTEEEDNLVKAIAEQSELPLVRVLTGLVRRALGRPDPCDALLAIPVPAASMVELDSNNSGAAA